MRVSLSAVTCTAAVTLASCTLAPHYDRPALPVSPDYAVGAAFSGYGTTATDAGERADALGWRDFFLDPVMQDLIALALTNNRDLRVSALNVEAARAQYRVQRAALLPSINAAGYAEYTHLPANIEGNPSAETLHIYSLGLDLASYELDLFGRLRSLTKEAQEQYLSSVDTRTSAQISLISEVASSYLTWLADRDAVHVSGQTADAQQKSYDLIHLTLLRGTGTGLDVAQAESTLRTAQASLEQYTRQAAEDLDEIVLLVGAPLPADLQMRMMAESGIAAHANFPSLSAGVPSDLLARRPDIRAAEHTLLAANANIGAARAAFFPSITLTANDGTASTSLSQLFGAGTRTWLFEPQINVPIFEGGKNLANLSSAKIEKRIEIATYEKTIQSAFHDVSNALAGRSTYLRQLQAEQQLVDADQRYYTLSKMRFDAGSDSFLNVLVAQNSLFSAQLTLISLNLAERQNLVSLYQALGGGWTDKTTAVADN